MNLIIWRFKVILIEHGDARVLKTIDFVENTSCGFYELYFNTFLKTTEHETQKKLGYSVTKRISRVSLDPFLKATDKHGLKRILVAFDTWIDVTLSFRYFFPKAAYVVTPRRYYTGLLYEMHKQMKWMLRQTDERLEFRGYGFSRLQFGKIGCSQDNSKANQNKRASWDFRDLGGSVGIAVEWSVSLPQLMLTPRPYVRKV